MLPPKLSLPAAEQRLLKLYRSLADEDRRGLVAFAEFLNQRGERAGDDTGESKIPAEPLEIPRPDAETVISAIRRLVATYPMLNRDELLHDTSELMTAHVLQGRAADTVIDELEVVFRRKFDSVESGRS
ncbi:MAG: Crp/Fnr family transcriptional regulator [Gammaproteobacteria bacterium]|nr:Crp/Fnr family transcriptional regulator [Gammaproteobacteria bacterium]